MEGDYIVTKEGAYYNLIDNDPGLIRSFDIGTSIRIRKTMPKWSSNPFVIYWDVWMSTINQDQFDQISQYLEKIPEGEESQSNVKNDHEGMVYNPITDSWSWF